jgi:uncharacterized protein YciW
MDRLQKLHRTLSTASSLLDLAAQQIREAQLEPTKNHITTIAYALAGVFDVQQSIYKHRPELEPELEEAPGEVREANRRLGNALNAAYALEESGKADQAVSVLAAYVSSEASNFHKQLAENEIERLSKS